MKNGGRWMVLSLHALKIENLAEERKRRGEIRQSDQILADVLNRGNHDVQGSLTAVNMQQTQIPMQTQTQIQTHIKFKYWLAH